MKHFRSLDPFRGLLSAALACSPCLACTFFLRDGEVGDAGTETASTQGDASSTTPPLTTGAVDCTPEPWEGDPTEGDPIPEPEGGPPLCVPLVVAAGCDDSVMSIELVIRAQHLQLGDLSARLFKPGAMENMEAGILVIDRPGLTEYPPHGAECNFDPTYELVITDSPDAPPMEELLKCWGVDAAVLCSLIFADTNPIDIDACTALAANCRVGVSELSMLVGTPVGGTWHFCIEDLSPIFPGELISVELSLNAGSAAHVMLGAID